MHVLALRGDPAASAQHDDRGFGGRQLASLVDAALDEQRVGQQKGRIAEEPALAAFGENLEALAELELRRFRPAGKELDGPCDLAEACAKEAVAELVVETGRARDERTCLVEVPEHGLEPCPRACDVRL